MFFIIDVFVAYIKYNITIISVIGTKNDFVN